MCIMEFGPRVHEVVAALRMPRRALNVQRQSNASIYYADVFTVSRSHPLMALCVAAKRAYGRGSLSVLSSIRIS